MTEPNRIGNKGAGGQVEQRVRDAKDSLPGERDALPPGTLPQCPPEPQGDEHREPLKPSAPPP